MSRRAFLLLTALCGCSLLTSFDEQKLTEDTFERCQDAADNDGDTLTDCDDPDCGPFASICAELTPEACSDGADNDGDGRVDCEDRGCVSLPDVCVEKTQQACSDGADNDGDGQVDCKDPDCSGLLVCKEIGTTDCSDGEDNDGDGLVDCSDFDCYTQKRCCDLAPPSFSGDDFSYQSSCSIHVCSKSEPSCCDTGYELCNAFDPEKWIAWGLPRARQANGAFVANEPCGCESSGVVSVEYVPLQAGLTLAFDFDLDTKATPPSSICAGLTWDTSFIDDHHQCVGVAQPRLLVGACLELEEEPAKGVRASVLMDGQVQTHGAVSGGGPFHATIQLLDDGVAVSVGSLSYKTTPIDPGLTRALVLIRGRGTTATLRSLTIKAPGASAGRCRNPAAWYRHLARGGPVVYASFAVPSVSQPSVIYRPDTKTYQMLFVGRVTPLEGTWDGMFWAESTDGLVWEVSEVAVMPRSRLDASFGTAQRSPSLLYWQGKYHVWYTREERVGSQTQRAIAHAVSTDGFNWKHNPGSAGGTFVLDPGKAPGWDSRTVGSPAVLEKEDGSLLMWYTGTRYEIGDKPAIGVAGSADGTKWQRLQLQPVLQPEPGSDELAYDSPAVVYDATSHLYRMWYTHRAFGKNPTIRYAVSTDGVDWTKWSDKPAFSVGGLGTFDERGVADPSVMLTDRIKLWYTGLNRKGVEQVGYAENRGAL